MARYSMTASVQGDFDEAKARVTQALQEQGFGVLTEIDVQRTLQQKLGADMERYLILGACNPQLARQALDTERSIGLLLPCNVVLREDDGAVEVAILDPEVMFEVADETTRSKLAGLPAEARRSLAKVLLALKGGAR